MPEHSKKSEEEIRDFSIIQRDTRPDCNVHYCHNEHRDFIFLKMKIWDNAEAITASPNDSWICV